MTRLRSSLHYLVPFLLLIGIVAFRVYVPVVAELQLKVFDVFMRAAPRAYVPQPVRLLDIDDESLAKIGQFPWPRTVLAELVARLANMGAGLVVFDIVFAEKDRTSPANILPAWPSTPEIDALRAKSADLPDHDAVFADIIAQAGNVITGFVLSDVDSERAPAQKGSFATAGDDPKPFLPSFTGAVVNLKPIEDAALGNGSFNLVAETDNVIRRVPLFIRLGDKLYPSLSAEALRLAQGARTFILKASGASGETAFGETTGLNSVKIGRIEVPTDANGRIWIHDTGSIPERYVPAWKVFDGSADPTKIAGNIIVVGTSAAGLQDIRSTPLTAAVAGAEVHVQAMEQMLLGHFLERPDWAYGAEILYLVLLGLVLIILIPRLGGGWTAALGFGAIVGVCYASWYLFTEQRWLLDPIIPSLAVITIFLASSLLNYLRTEAEKAQVRDAFSHYMSPALVEQLAAEPDRLVLGGEMRDMTLLFADIRGFTAISEQFKSDPQGLTQLINQFLTPMTDMILSRRGTIDKYMGDCIMAFWNAPLDDDQHAANGNDSALAMFTALEDVNAEIKRQAEEEGRKFFPINIGIGLNSGEVCVGNMGSVQRFDYSVLGDAVNLAARLEGQSKNYGVGIVIGEETYKRAPDYAVIELDLIAVKGKEEAVHIFSLLGDAEKAQQPDFKELSAEHIKMLDAYRSKQFDEARALVKKCRALDGQLEVLYDLYDERLDAYEEVPPPEDWDGVFVATSK